MEADKFFPFFLFPSLLVKLDFYHNRVNYVPFVQEIDPNPKFGIVFKFRDTNIFFYERTRNILQKVTTRDFSTRIEPVRTRGNKRNETRQAGFSVDESLRNSLGTRAPRIFHLPPHFGQRSIYPYTGLFVTILFTCLLRACANLSCHRFACELERYVRNSKAVRVLSLRYIRERDFCADV